MRHSLMTLRHSLSRLRSRLRMVHPDRWLRATWQSFGGRYAMADHTQVTVYSRRPDLFQDYPLRQSLPGRPTERRVSISLVATARNEGDDARRFLASLLAQTRQPDEIVIVDGGSHDNTLAVLQEFAASSPVPCKILSEPGANISRGRNIAIANCGCPVVAVIDFGCRARPDWLKNLVAPFEIDPKTDVAAGWYETVDAGGQKLERRWWMSWRYVQPQQFLPSSRSLAFTKAAWEAAGRYPEWLTLTGEDTYFDLQLKRSTQFWAFVPEAVVEWPAPVTPRACWQKLHAWAIGDGEAGINAGYFQRKLFLCLQMIGWALVTLGLVAGAFCIPSLGMWAVTLAWALASVLFLAWKLRAGKYGLAEFAWEVGNAFAITLGFLRGWSRRRSVDRRRFQGVAGVFFILSGIPIDDTGGGARCTQIALELLNQNWLVVFLNKFSKYETVELDLQIRHPNLITARSAAFSVERFWKRYGDVLSGKPSVTLIEFPLPDFIPLIEALRRSGSRVVYDLLDDWSTSLGTKWYSADIERTIAAAADALVATAPALARRLEQMAPTPVALLPNAVNARLFNPRRYYPRPPDMPGAAWCAIYIGALWGDWFDWELLESVGTTYPEAAVVVIGDYAGQCPNPPPNVHFLGLKAQRDLPAYLAHAQVALVPWKMNEITQATSPLKVYEYLAMRKPVVAPAIQPLRDLPGVFLAQNRAEFVAMVGALRQTTVPEADVAVFIEQNNWQARVDALLSFLTGSIEL
jgi:hypothetical protein